MPASPDYKPDTFEPGDQVVSWMFHGTHPVASVSDDGESVFVDLDPPRLPAEHGPEDLRKDVPAPITMALAGMDRLHVVRAGADEADFLLAWTGDLVWKGNVPPSQEWLFADPLDCDKADQALTSEGWTRVGRWVRGEDNWTAVVEKTDS